ncbi:ABC transporter permease [Leucobacter insecticola]|uniref:ABC transporter permease n=1 Tax=Leucobacter insecticola TaxID=2714934 RepID=A0A6G8FLE5_9MICO|nr:ABC transporter permease [Leucobacter insecticola]QIM17171.1 ABC transporter permease [Leucobacter insecticola]
MTTEALLTAPRVERGWHAWPLIKQLRQSIGLQRGMLIVGLILVSVFVITALFAPLLAPYSFSALSGPDGDFGSLQQPSLAHPFGTTTAGYDVLSRVIWGARTAFLVIAIAVASSIFLGSFLGLLSGYVGGWLDRVLVMLADAIYAFPSLLLAIVLSIVISGGQSSMWGGIWAASLSITVVFIPQYLRVVRSEVIRVKSEAFVESARVVGASNARIMFRHVMRNSTRSLPLVFTLNASEAILTLAGLGFLGFGIEPNSAAEWGYDLNKAIADVTNGVWWTSLWPGIAIVLVVTGLTLTGESLNDLSDPRLRSRRRAKAGSGKVSDNAVGVAAEAIASAAPTAPATREGDAR